MRTYVINLDGHDDCLARMSGQLAREGVPFVRVPGVVYSEGGPGAEPVSPRGANCRAPRPLSGAC